ncbi:glutathione S-transferase [Cladophialophora yegresii CBS 114405]|uniref:Glutathione S-transferase n=1 Tax=Cladophialophora yegresii CBS 114405 TaxID=1182544 RepID=W9VLR3_9EURO|nr:glutathione S-transferase [Cladophialophora yegresii CBS 114405]EXJ53925.1 glutathione S-transferase [Cladophialophora yegresii CBS 114405]
MATNGTSHPEIILYTNHGCPWAHRAHIVIKELGLPYKEEIIDLDRPRDPWYLKVNPRGLVPSISYNGEIIIESAVVAQFLADAHPSSLLPPSTGASNALYRARVNFFADTFITKALPHIFAGQRGQSEAEKDEAAESLVAAVVKELEPLFTWDPASKGPFFGGSERVTLAEALTGPFVLRLLALSKPEYGILSPKLHALLEEKTPKFQAWASRVIEQPSVTYIWNEKAVAERTKARFAKLAAEKKL